MARDISLSCKHPALWAAGAIPTLDFILHRRGAAVKKMRVKSKDWTRAETAVIAFLNGDVIMRWAEVTLGL
jgi:hypothetical protein